MCFGPNTNPYVERKWIGRYQLVEGNLVPSLKIATKNHCPPLVGGIWPMPFEPLAKEDCLWMPALVLMFVPNTVMVEYPNGWLSRRP
jgi:hypothetical protein